MRKEFFSGEKPFFPLGSNFGLSFRLGHREDGAISGQKETVILESESDLFLIV